MTKEDAIRLGCYDRYNPEGKTPLKYDDYKQYEVLEETNTNDWSRQLRRVFKFPNGYGASVIKSFGSYGFETDEWELAVLLWKNDNTWELCYTSEITDDVIGWLTNEAVLEYLERIKNLK